MNKLFKWLFGPKPAKEKLKNHPHHVSCDYGLTNFNENKRSRKFVEEANAAWLKTNKGHGHGGGGGTPPPPPPPTPSLTTAVILVDFDGATVSGTSWNTAGDIVCAYSGLTLDEQEIVMAAIVQAYAAFNLIVTRDESVYNAADPKRRTRLIITESYEWYGKSGGVAFISSMSWGNDTPCFVFSSLLGHNTRYIGAAGAHEPGHTIGLRHQSKYDSSCVKVAEYNPGDGVNSPYMGYPYSLPPKWWDGPDSIACDHIQHDAEMIKNYIGLKV